MITGRSAVLWGLVGGHAAGQGRRVSVSDVCAVASQSADMGGAWVTAARDLGPDFVMCVTAPVCETIAELQLTLGEGPCCDVLTSAAPVLAPDLGDAESSRRWPAFTAEARRLGVAALFAFPLTIGAIRTGVMGLYRDTPGQLPDEQFADSLLLADAATMLLLDTANGGAGVATDGAALDGQSPDLAMHRVEIDQATGMLMVQLGSVTAAEAFVRLRAYAYAQDRRLADVARDIVARRLRLKIDPEPGGDS